MNPTIERLAREAGLTEYGMDLQKRYWDADDSEIEAFAKAVARECAEIARTNENPWTVAQAIRERFGL